MTIENEVIFLVGPTAVGKTEAGLALAEETGAEIVSADSRQIYKMMDIGTAKPSPADRARVPHHLVDVLSPDREYSAGEYARDALRIIAEIHGRGKRALVVGGAGLYVSALTEGVFGPRVSDPEIKARLKMEVVEQGAATLHQRLAKVDPLAAERIQPGDGHRIVRALEVFELTGAPISTLQQAPAAAALSVPYLMLGLTRKRSALYHRIEQRVDWMLDQGLVEECKRIQQAGYDPHLNALNTVGYRECYQFLGGDISYEEMVRLIKQHTRNYAKRQLTWFRKRDVHWVEIESASNLELIVEQLRRLLR